MVLRDFLLEEFGCGIGVEAPAVVERDLEQLMTYQLSLMLEALCQCPGTITSGFIHHCVEDNPGTAGVGNVVSYYMYFM